MRARRYRVGWGLAGVVLLLSTSQTGCHRARRDDEKKPPRLAHEGGIPVIPRGKITLSAARGERYLLEIEAPVNLNQALAFYRRQLARENWGEFQVQKVRKGFWGLQARRGMFVLTGRLKALGPHRTTIGFERRVRAAEQAWVPPVPPDVPLLPGTIVWQERVFDLGGGAVELRGRAVRPPQPVRDAVRAALERAGWTLRETGDAMRLLAERTRPGKKKPRQIRYRFDGTRTGTQVRLGLALEELTRRDVRAGPRPSGGAARRAPAARPPAPPPRIAIPEPVRLWDGGAPPTVQRLTKKVLSVTYERPCVPLPALRQEVEKRLRARGWKLLQRPPLAAGLASHATESVTATRRKLLLVAIVARDLDACLVTLTVTQK